jgi:hypothetical protein
MQMPVGKESHPTRGFSMARSCKKAVGFQRFHQDENKLHKLKWV